jgi:hypothetical protein
MFAADQRGKARGTHCLEAILGRALTDDLGRRYRLGEPVEPQRAEVSVGEQIADETARGIRDDDTARLCKCLQSGGQVRSLSDHRTLLCFVAPDKISDYHLSRSNADSRGERLSYQSRYGGGHSQPGPHGALGRVLVRNGPTKIHQNTIAHILCDMSIEPCNLGCHPVAVCAKYIAQFFRI